MIDFASRLLATNLGSPNGVTTQDKWVHQLWHITFYFAVPIGVIVFGAVLWCVFRYRDKPGSERKPAQFQYHIPIEAAYTIIPLVIVAIVFGFMYNAENKVDAVVKNPDVKITVEGFQWGWNFIYQNGHEQVGTVANELNINSTANLPILYVPTDETVQLHIISLDVVHTFYVPEFLFQRDLVPGVLNTFDVNVTTANTPAHPYYLGECNNICGQYHAYMRFKVVALTPSFYQAWYTQQNPCSITTAGEGTAPGPVNCPTSLSTENLSEATS